MDKNPFVFFIIWNGKSRSTILTKTKQNKNYNNSKTKTCNILKNVTGTRLVFSYLFIRFFFFLHKLVLPLQEDYKTWIPWWALKAVVKNCHISSSPSSPTQYHIEYFVFAYYGIASAVVTLCFSCWLIGLLCYAL